VLHRLVDLGNAVICIEHNLDLIKNADWIIDLGPEAGDAGGELVVNGTPEDIAGAKGSHTGAALKPILQAGPYKERPVATLEHQRKREAELRSTVKLDESDGGGQMPWQIDGEKWHVQTHLDRDGHLARWDASLLSWIIDTVHKLGSFAPTDWNHASRVEITQPGASMWFLHALTRGSKLLDVCLRIPTGTFDAMALIRKLGLKSLDQREDLPIYGGWPRVQIRSVDRAWDNVRILLHDQKDLKKTAFRRVLKAAVEAYKRRIGSEKKDVKQAQPWKHDAKTWHIQQQALKSRHKRARWNSAALLELIGMLNRMCPEMKLDWRAKVCIQFYVGKQQVGKLVTNMPQGMRVELRTPRNAMTPTQVEGLGSKPEIQRYGQYDNVRFWTTGRSDIATDKLKHVLVQMRRYVNPPKAGAA